MWLVVSKWTVEIHNTSVTTDVLLESAILDLKVVFTCVFTTIKIAHYICIICQ